MVKKLFKTKTLGSVHIYIISAFHSTHPFFPKIKRKGTYGGHKSSTVMVATKVVPSNPFGLKKV